MPYSKKAERTIRAVAHGWKPKKKDIDLTQTEAKRLSKHITKKSKKK